MFFCCGQMDLLGVLFYDGGGGGRPTRTGFLLSTAGPPPSTPPNTPVPSRTLADQPRNQSSATVVAAGLTPRSIRCGSWFDATRSAHGHSYGAQAASWLDSNGSRLKAGPSRWTPLCLPSGHRQTRWPHSRASPGKPRRGARPGRRRTIPLSPPSARNAS